MSLYSISPTVCAVFALLLGFFVFFQGRKSIVNLTFSFLCLATAWWQLSWAALFSASSNDLILSLVRIGYSGIIFIPITFFSFIVVFLRSDADRPLAFISYFLGVVFLAFLWPSNYFINGYYQFSWGYYPRAGILLPFYLGLLFVLNFRAFILLFASIIAPFGSQIKKSQSKYLLLGLFIYSFAAVDFIVNYGFGFYPFGFVFVVIALSVIPYAILTTRLMDIEIVIKQSVVYGSFAIALSAIYYGTTYLSNMVFEQLTGRTGIWAAIPSILAISVLFQPTLSAIQRLADQLMFRTRYRYQKVLNRYSHALTQPTTDISRLAKLAPYITTKAMGLRGASFLLLNRDASRYEVRGAVRDAEHLTGYFIAEENPLVVHIKQTKGTLAKDEIEHLLSTQTLSPQERQRLKDIVKQMERLKSVLVIPSISESEYFGEPALLSLLCLGAKVSEEPFSADDIAFLESMAAQATITVEYAIILEDLERKRTKLVEAEKLASLGTMAAGVAHEIKNPLSALKLFTEVIPQKFEDPEYRTKFATLIPSELARLRKILSDLDIFSKPVAETTGPFSVKDVMDKTLQFLEVQFRKGGIKVDKQLSGVPLIEGSSSKMMQVFLNLIMNAVQAMEGGGGLTIKTEEQGAKVKVEIADTGSGIPQDKIKMIFDPFFTTKETGTGLGLAITKRIIEEHKGTIDVESEVGKGTKFTLSFPVA